MSGKSISRSRLRAIQRVSVDSPTPRFSAVSRRVRPLVRAQAHRLVLKLLRESLQLGHRVCLSSQENSPLYRGKSKPVQLVLNGENPAPSDFVRSEWISYKRGEEAALHAALDESLAVMNALAAFYRDIGEVALEAERPDLELAFERFKQGVLIGNDAKSREGVSNVRNRLIEARDVEGRDDMATHRDRLFKSVSAFLRLLPAA